MNKATQLDLGYSSAFLKLPTPSDADGPCSKTSPAFSRHMKGGILLQWLEGWLGSKLTFQETGGELPDWRLGQKDSSSGSYWMHNTSDWRNGGSVCLLSEILETGQIDPRYYLSAKACAGILRRAERRGKELPHQLRDALTAVAQMAPAER